jgi:DME family drug/metabolite transporter
MQHTVTDHHRRPGIGALLVVIAALLWGTAGLVGAVVHTRSGLTPVSIGFWRLAIGAVATLPLLTRSLPHAVAARGAAPHRRPAAARRTQRALVGAGVALAVYQTCFFVAVTLVGVSVATLGSAPLLITVAGRVLLGETVERTTVVAIGVGLTGLALLISGSPEQPGSAPLAGAGLAVVSALGYTGLTLISRRGRGRQSVITFAAASFLLGALAAQPAAAWQGLHLPDDGVTVLLLVNLGVGPTALAYIAFFTGLRTVTAADAAILTLLEPAAATLLAVVLLGERLGPMAAAGALVLLATTTAVGVAQSRASAVTSHAGPIPRSRRWST